VRTTAIARLLASDQDAEEYVSLYLATGAGHENAPHELALRWKNARHALSEGGAPEAALAAIDPVLTDPPHAGRRLHDPAIGVIATADGVRWSGGLPAGILEQEVTASHGPLPDVLPLLAAAQAQVPHVAVLTDRTGAEIAARLPDGGDRWSERLEQVEGDDSPSIRRSAPGGWSQPRYQQRAEVKWDQNANLVADELVKLVEETRPRFVAAAGDVRALQFLRDNAPKRLRELLRVVGGDYGSLERVFERADELVAETVAADTTALLAKFTEEFGQDDRATAGAADTLPALTRGQVATLLVCEQCLADRTAWFGPAPTDLTLDPDDLSTAGVPAPHQTRLADVAVRAALGTDAEVRVLTPADAEVLPDGLGALLRF
jgi:hypothetical protein